VYVIISSVLIVSILISAFAVNLSRTGEILSEPEYVEDYSYLIHDNTQYDFNNDKIAIKVSMVVLHQLEVLKIPQI